MMDEVSLHWISHSARPLNGSGILPSLSRLAWTDVGTEQGFHDLVASGMLLEGSWVNSQESEMVNLVIVYTEWMERSVDGCIQ